MRTSRAVAAAAAAAAMAVTMVEDMVVSRVGAMASGEVAALEVVVMASGLVLVMVVVVVVVATLEGRNRCSRCQGCSQSTPFRIRRRRTHRLRHSCTCLCSAGLMVAAAEVAAIAKIAATVVVAEDWTERSGGG